MPKYGTDRIRNVAIVGHKASGKTTLTEAMLYAAKAIGRQGQVEDGNTTADYEPEEIAHQQSILPALCHLEWQGHKINIIDTPGAADYVADVTYALRVAEAAVLVVDSIAGVEVYTERVYALARRMGKPVLVVVNKMDKPNVDFDQAVASIGDRLVDCKPVTTHLPIGQEDSFRGVVDLLAGKAVTGEEPSPQTGGIPEEAAGAAEAAYGQLVEEIASTDDALTERYLEEADLSKAELGQALKGAAAAGAIAPVLATSALKCIGITPLLDAIVALVPSPAASVWEGTNGAGEAVTRPCSAAEPAAVFVWKTMSDKFVGRISLLRVVSGELRSDSALTSPRGRSKEKFSGLATLQGKEMTPASELAAGDLGVVTKLSTALTGDSLYDEKALVAFPPPELPLPMYSASAEATSKADQDKLSAALARLVEEDTSISYERNQETGDLVVTGMGPQHLRIAMERAGRIFDAQVALGTPKIAYRETVRGSARVQGRHKKQTGGRGQFGDVWIRLEPMERGGGYEFVDEVKGGSVPRNFIAAVEKGIQDAMQKGALAGYPVVDLRVILDDGSSHPVDSSEIAFRLAGQIALRSAMEKAGMLLLEPVVEVEVVTPEEYLGDVMSDFSSKRGRVLGTEPSGRNTVISAQAPQAELANYEAELRSMTQARASFSMRFSHYEEVPAHITERIVAQSQAAAGDN